MAFKLPRIPRGMMDEPFRVFWDRVCTDIETQEGTQDDLLAAVVAAQAAADAADAAADAAQTAADAAQATADAIVVPPTGSRTVSANTALTSADYAVLVDASGGAVTITLPAAATAENSIVITKIDASGNAVNVAPDGSDQINDAGSSVAVTSQYTPRVFNSDGTADWYG